METGKDLMELHKTLRGRTVEPVVRALAETDDVSLEHLAARIRRPLRSIADAVKHLHRLGLVSKVTTWRGTRISFHRGDRRLRGLGL